LGGTFSRLVRIIVYNPAGGAAIWGWRLRAALRELQSQGPSVLVATEAKDMVGPIRRALASTEGVTQVVACGGDGTVGACAAALDGKDIPIAVIPTGTTNVLTFELGLPNHPLRAARVLSGAMRPVSYRTWSVNGRLMLLQLGVGFDGHMLWHTPRSLKRAAGFLGVVASSMRVGPFYDYPRMTVEGERESGERLSAEVTSVMVANCKRWAGPQLAVPTADPSDDLVDVLLIDYRHYFQLARFWFGILFPDSPHLRLPYVKHVRMRRLSIRASGRPVEAHIDGEPDVTTPLVVEPRGRVTLLGL
jgi:diacylglycerol kinase (ATP)